MKDLKQDFYKRYIDTCAEKYRYKFDNQQVDMAITTFFGAVADILKNGLGKANSTSVFTVRDLMGNPLVAFKGTNNGDTIITTVSNKEEQGDISSTITDVHVHPFFSSHLLKNFNGIFEPAAIATIYMSLFDVANTLLKEQPNSEINLGGVLKIESVQDGDDIKILFELGDKFGMTNKNDAASEKAA